MTEKMTQDQRLDYLVEEFKKDSVQYKDLETPKDTEGKRYVLRSLMNIRMPKPFPEEALAVQDDYLTGGYHKACRGCHRQCRQFSDAGLLCAHAYLH